MTIPSTTPSMLSSYASVLSSSSPVFYRPGVFAVGPASISLMSITPSTSRPITTLSTPRSASSLYAGALSPNSSLFSRPQTGSGVQYFYQAIQVTVSVAVVAIGPASVGLTSITPNTTLLTTYPSTLRASSPVFYRPNGEKTDLYYYQTIQVTVPKDGTYSFASVSDISTIGYLYDTSFDPFNPSSNLAIYSDNGGVRRGFRINFLLAPGRTYILVVTTSQTSVMGDFWILARGPALVSLRSIPSTGLTTTTSSPTTSANNPLTVATSPRGSASIKTNSITITVICMLIMSMLRILQQRLF
ncbi:unnamed protein product [Rotaria sordida]|uniref:Uncharacterized protein n=1 Tax=Rotaria sordida TaxID=392033 RepID=A0A815BQR1_9BILA|nr:unnamed protein product [Rotaria sordida]CAF1273109.1 unnamed protein product [Rotaria sordida]